MKMSRAIPRKDAAGRIIAKQVLRSGTSVAANYRYRACCRARNQTEFISRIGIVEEEADETKFWIELLIDSGIMPARKLRDSLIEANELTAIMVASRKTAANK